MLKWSPAKKGCEPLAYSMPHPELMFVVVNTIAIQADQRPGIFPLICKTQL